MKIYLFDIDGVLIRSDIFTVGIQESYGIGKEFLDGFFKRDFANCLIGESDLRNSITPHIELSDWKSGTDNLIEFWFKYENKPNIDLIEQIQDLRKNGDICCTISNQEKYRSDYIRDTMGFKGFFDKMYFSYEIGFKKPEIKFYEYIYLDLINNFGPVSKEKIIFIDDNQRNVDIGNYFGFKSNLFISNEEASKRILSSK